jgi:hypothetical protein
MSETQKQAPRFANVSCSQCGQDFGPGDSGFSHCADHAQTPQRAYQFRESGSHYNGGAVFFGYGYDAIGEPRLMMVRRWYRQGDRRGQTEDHFFIDGSPVESYAKAIEALKTPPLFTIDELAALRQIGDEPTDQRKTLKYETLYFLRCKGAIEWGPRGHCKRTAVARAALSKAGE